jgi:mono/diheme cytochrome c family protein
MRLGGSIVLGITIVVAVGAKAASPSADKLARGKYLVEDAGQCQDCHTPRNETGEYVKERWMKGTVLMFKPTIQVPDWAEKSANIAGLPGWTDEQAVKFFMTGIAYNELPARPPMPAYRFSREDAEAMVAYLRSLAPAGK